MKQVLQELRRTWLALARLLRLRRVHVQPGVVRVPHGQRRQRNLHDGVAHAAAEGQLHVHQLQGLCVVRLQQGLLLRGPVSPVQRQRVLMLVPQCRLLLPGRAWPAELLSPG